MSEINPFLEQENYFKQYQENIENLKNKPEVIEMDRLCFELFEMNEMGKRFLELAKEKWVIPSLAMKGSANYQHDVIWGEGFKEVFRFILGSIRSHQQRIQAGK